CSAISHPLSANVRCYNLIQDLKHAPCSLLEFHENAFPLLVPRCCFSLALHWLRKDPVSAAMFSPFCDSAKSTSVIKKAMEQQKTEKTEGVPLKIPAHKGHQEHNGKLILCDLCALCGSYSYRSASMGSSREAFRAG